MGPKRAGKRLPWESIAEILWRGSSQHWRGVGGAIDTPGGVPLHMGLWEAISGGSHNMH